MKKYFFKGVPLNPEFGGEETSQSPNCARAGAQHLRFLPSKPPLFLGHGLGPYCSMYRDMPKNPV
ncbi:MAG: hypothetical protein J6W63_07880, partial [Treponema sp.]|nr:hypothetical protein [Treponema sp.]